MNSRLVAAGLIWGALLAVPVSMHAADSRPATRSTGQAVGRATSLTVPRIQTQRTSKLAASNSAVGRMPFNPSQLTGNTQVLAAANSASSRGRLNSHPARSGGLSLIGPRSNSGVLQLVPASDPSPSGQKVLTLVPQPKSGQKVLTLVPQPKSGQKVLTLVPQPQPPAGDRSAQILQFSDDEPQPAATIMPLGTTKESKPAATLLQFAD